MNKKIIVSLIILGIISFTSYAYAVNVNTPKSSVSEIVNTVKYTKNIDGTLNKIEQITRTTVINPKVISSKIDSLSNELQDLQNQKALLDQQEHDAPLVSLQLNSNIKIN